MRYYILAIRRNGLKEECFESGTREEMIDKLRDYCLHVSESEACLELSKRYDEGLTVSDDEAFYAVFEDYQSAKYKVQPE